MNYPRVEVPYSNLRLDQRVYVKDLDVFGRARPLAGKWVIVCEAPMTGYVYHIEGVLYNEAIGDRDPEDEPSVMGAGAGLPPMPTEEDEVPIDEREEGEDEAGILRKAKEKALIFVMERKTPGRAPTYDALILDGTEGIRDEMQQMSREASDHEGLHSIYPRTKGLWIWEGTLVYHKGPDEMPQWEGDFRNMTQQDFKDLGV